MQRQNKIFMLFVYRRMSSFVKNDYNFFNKTCRVRKFQFRAEKSFLQQIHDQLFLFFWLLLSVPRARFIFIWFADYHSFLPVFFARIFHKHSYIALGGYDVTHLPDLDYGSYKNKIRAAMTTYSIRNATCVFPVADNLLHEAKSRVPDVRIRVVYTGFDAQKFYHNGTEKKPLVLTVAAGHTEQRIRLKGIDVFIRLAHTLPQYQFAVVGMDKSALEKLETIPANTTLYDYLSDEALLRLFREAKVYGQFSRREGLPTALCEAMLCECIPVGFNNGGIPIAMGECGFLVQDRDLDAAREAIHNAMNLNAQAGQNARKRVMDHFSIERREKTLSAILLAEDEPNTIILA